MASSFHQQVSRRTALAAVGGGAAAAALGVGGAAAATRWRTLPERVSPPPVAPPTSPAPVSYRGGMVTVSSDPIPRTRLKTGELVIHPTQLGNLLKAHTDAWTADHNRGHLTFASTVLEALVARAVPRQGAVFLAYEFPWHSDNGPMPDPWFSAFGQAKFPAVAHALYRVTGERRWLLHRDAILNAFRLPPVASRPGLPWVAGVDANNCLWLEEYPYPDGRLSTVFNGHYYSLYELADYQQRSGDATVSDLVQGGAATLDFYRNYCRCPGSYSNYYANNANKTPSYHPINESCYLGLYNMTGLARLGTTVDQLIRDWHITTAAGQVRLAKAPLTIARWTTNTVGQLTSWTPPSALLVSTSGRGQWLTPPGVWLRMTSGPKAGWYVRETPGLAYVTGVATDRADFTRPREVRFQPGQPITGYRWSTDGIPTAVTTRALPAASLAHSRSRALVGGRQHIHVEDGIFAGLWLREGGPVIYR